MTDERSRLLVIEDGTEYEEFARLFLGERFDIVAAHGAEEALALAHAGLLHAMLVDLRFERARSEDLIGDVPAVARRMFGGDVQRALRWLKDQQGTLILAELRKAGFAQPAVFVHDFPAERLANLRKLYGAVHAVPTFDAVAIRAALSARVIAG